MTWREFAQPRCPGQMRDGWTGSWRGSVSLYISEDHDEITVDSNPGIRGKADALRPPGAVTFSKVLPRLQLCQVSVASLWKVPVLQKLHDALDACPLLKDHISSEYETQSTDKVLSSNLCFANLL